MSSLVQLKSKTATWSKDLRKLFSKFEGRKAFGVGFGGGLVVLGGVYGLGGLDSVVTSSYYGTLQVPLLKYTTMAASCVLGFGLGWITSAKGKAFRTAAYGTALASILFATAVDYGTLGTMAAMAGGWIAFFAGLGYWVKGRVSELAKLPTTFGSAAWATVKDLLDQNLFAKDGLRLGRYWISSQGYYSLSYKGDRHILTFAPTRGGKGTTAIIPNLLTYQGSSVVIDPKGENAMITAARRKAMGQVVHVVDPYQITGEKASKFNPLDLLVKGDAEILDKAMILADAIVVKEGGQSQFWDEEAKSLLVGVMLYVATEKSEQRHRHLGRVRDLLTLDGDELKKLFEKMTKSAYHGVRSVGAMCLQKEERLLSSVMASVQAQTHFLASSHLRESLSTSDFSFGDLKSKPMSVYLVLPADKLDSHGRWLRLMIQQALSVNAQNIEKQPERPVLFILDEMAALGRLPMVEQAFGLMAGFGIQLWGIAQDASQLKRIYGDGWESFVSNAGVLQYFGSRDKFTAEYFSSLCGVTSVWDISTGISRAFGYTSGSNPSNSKTVTHSDNASAKQRQLAYPDELMRMADGRQLLLVNNGNPILASKVPWFEDEELKELGVNLHKPKLTAKAT